MSELASVKTNISELRHAADDKCVQPPATSSQSFEPKTSNVCHNCHIVLTCVAGTARLSVWKFNCGKNQRAPSCKLRRKSARTMTFGSTGSPTSRCNVLRPSPAAHNASRRALQSMMVHQPSFPSSYDSYPSPAISFGLAAPHGGHNYGNPSMYQPPSALPPISARSHLPTPSKIPSAAAGM